VPGEVQCPTLSCGNGTGPSRRPGRPITGARIDWPTHASRPRAAQGALGLAIWQWRCERFSITVGVQIHPSSTMGAPWEFIVAGTVPPAQLPAACPMMDAYKDIRRNSTRLGAQDLLASAGEAEYSTSPICNGTE